ncbi:MAG: FAD-binding protein [Bacteroidales bacterium]|nr:FAD-binding protein [Bacteroidales bacterium]
MKTISIDLTPEEYCVPELMRRAVAGRLGIGDDALETLHVTRRTLDCRRRNILYHTEIAIGSPDEFATPSSPRFPAVKADAPRVVVVGAGPAGLFAALTLLEHGIRPVIVERGKPVEERKHDIARLTREKTVDPDSNWCFGEGGAGTYSDGKLYTRSTKRGDVGAVLRTFVAHGADPDIMLDAHAHIGTDRLSGIIARMRHTIEEAGGEYHFGTRVTDLIVKDGHARGVTDAAGDTIEGTAVILATGHSARDIYQLFHRHGWLLEAKPFALGVRVEHPQQLINEIQYHGRGYTPYLPPAAYSLTTQVGTHGVFSFCMCPGGVIVPAATAAGQQVVNGMSNSRRNSPYANSGIAVTVGLDDLPPAAKSANPLSLLAFQQEVEQRMFHAGGDAVNAPSQRLTDFLRRRSSSRLNKTGYMGDVTSAPLHELLPPFIVDSLIQGFKDFDRRMRGFITDEASLLAVESRTSSPVRIPRDKETLQHPQLQGLYPCGEGAGYAGGIVSSALDGIRCAEAVSLQR